MSDTVGDLPGLTPDSYARWRAAIVATLADRIISFLTTAASVLKQGPPYLLGKTSNLPMVLGFLGSIGSILAFGFVGLFLGPTLLAIGYDLFLGWRAAEIEERRHPTQIPSICPTGADVGRMDRSSADGEGRAKSIVDHGLQD